MQNTRPLVIVEGKRGFDVKTGNGTKLNSRPFKTREQAERFRQLEEARYAGPLAVLRHHVTGAIERGKKEAIVAIEA